MDNIVSLIKYEFNRRVVEEGLDRIQRCLTMVKEEDIWSRQNLVTNSIGNLILHLNGNVSQYILSGLGGSLDLRDRDREFSQRGGLDKVFLSSLISNTVIEANEVVRHLGEKEFLRKIPVQCFEEYGTSIVIHVIEHFSYHVGQITHITKSIANNETNYYEDLDLNQIAQ